MVHHIVLWNIRTDMSKQEKREAKEEIKKRLEAVKEKVEGIISLEVVTDELKSSNRDVGLISVFESEASLLAYQTHPAHVQAGEYIKRVTCDRACLDY